MPFKDKEAQLAYQRKWYAAHSDRTKKKVRDRKWNVYGGVCRNCGAKTMGETKGEGAEYCGKPECKSAQHKARRELFVQYGIQGRAAQMNHGKLAARRKARAQKIVSLDDLAAGY